MAGVPARPGRPRLARRRPGDQIRRRRSGQRDRRGAARTHYRRNLLRRALEAAQLRVSIQARTIFDLDDAGRASWRLLRSPARCGDRSSPPACRRG